MVNPFSGISVIICCYNSSSRLPETIRHLAAQSFQSQWEVVIVNNNSTDNTAQVVISEWEKYSVPNITLKIVDEPRPGLNFAREKGVTSAVYEYFIFCDDDNWLDVGYVATSHKIISQNQSIGAVGGECVPVTESGFDFPEWFGAIQNYYATGKQADKSGDITSRGYLWGAGVICSKTVFTKCVNNEFPYLLTDRMGMLLSSGGDTELCLRMILAGYTLYYDERLVLKHFIAKERLTKDYFNKLIAGIEASHSQLRKYDNLIWINSLSYPIKVKNILKIILKLLFNAVLGKWEFQREKQLFYLYTDVDLGVDKDLKMLKKFNARVAH